MDNLSSVMSLISSAIHHIRVLKERSFIVNGSLIYLSVNTSKYENVIAHSSLALSFSAALSTLANWEPRCSQKSRAGCRLRRMEDSM